MLDLKNYKLPLLVIYLISFSSISATAQNGIITKYFDSSWKKISKDSAFYYTEMVKEDTFYNCTSYWMKSKKLNCKSAYSDMHFTKAIGLLIRYYEDGQTEDSTYNNEDGTFENTFHYFPNGKLSVHYTWNPLSKKETTDAYNINGGRMANYVYMKEASFKESIADWQTYLSENVKTDVPVKKGAPEGKYLVIVRFIIGENGKILSAEAESNVGYGMEDEVIRILKKSPKWNPAIMMGKPVTAYRRQPITFMVAKQ